MKSIQQTEIKTNRSAALEIEDKLIRIETSLKQVVGANMFFCELKEDCDNHPDIAAMSLKNGVMQPKLEAIWSLFDNSTENIKNAIEKIDQLLRSHFLEQDKESELESIKAENDRLKEELQCVKGYHSAANEVINDLESDLRDAHELMDSKPGNEE